MAKFQTKPTIVEVWQFPAEGKMQDIPEWVSKHSFEALANPETGQGLGRFPADAKVTTDIEWIYVKPTDWLIEIDGILHALADEYFKDKFEEVRH